MPTAASERRRLMRIQLESPIIARVATSKVVLLDLSAEGARIEHNFPLAKGKEITLNFEYKDERVDVTCEVIRCKVERHAERISYFSGLRFHELQDAALAALRNIIADAITDDFEARQQHMMKIKK